MHNRFTTDASLGCGALSAATSVVWCAVSGRRSGGRTAIATAG
jgi:hypothetical protein